jgi:hypothetical protein
MNVHASLSVDARHDKVWITFRAENRGERRIWLPRALAYDPRPGGRVFDVRAHPGGAPIPYVGPAAAQGTPGDHTYELRYEGAVLGDIHQPDATTPLATEPVLFRHIAP